MMMDGGAIMMIEEEFTAEQKRMTICESSMAVRDDDAWWVVGTVTVEVMLATVRKR